MRYLILSDIHSNLEALEACLSRAGELDYTDAFCCGDIVGYGPNPREAIERVRQLKVQTVRGNHDRVAAGIDDDDNFNPYAREAAYWTRRALPEPLRGYLKSLPTGPLGVRSDAQLVHGALTHEDDYIFNERDAESSFELTRKPITFFGHSHFQVVFSLGPTGGPAVEPVDDSGADCRIRLRPGGRFLINPGSVGQPRDGDPRAAFAVWDTDAGSIEFYRVEYPVERTQEKMKQARLPSYLIQRLSHGR